jgi:hypothetical protein
MPILVWIEAHLSLLWLITAGLLLILLAWLVFMQVRLSRLLARYLTLMQGADGRNLEQVLDSYLAQARATAAQVDQLSKASRQLEKAAKLSLQHLGVVRFDAFEDVAGKQSFAVALVDGHGNGVVISSVASRQSTRTYAKPLRAWDAEYTLSEEEKQAIALAYQQRI